MPSSTDLSRFLFVLFVYVRVCACAQFISSFHQYYLFSVLIFSFLSLSVICYSFTRGSL